MLYSIQPAPRPIRPSALITHLPILVMEVHSQCNCRCVMCEIWQRTDRTQLHPDEILRHRDSLIALGVRQVVLTGGEPLLNQHLPRICDLLHELGIRITLLTTGLLLHQRAALLSTAVDEIIVSLDGPPEVHNAIRRVPRAFELIAKGVQTLRELNPAIPIFSRTTVQRLNHAHLRATVSAARALGLNGISFLPADLHSSAFNRSETWNRNDDGSWNEGQQSLLSLNPVELKQLETEIESLIQENEHAPDSNFIAENPEKLRRLANRFREHLYGDRPVAPQCNAPWVSSVLDLDGSLRPCFFHAPTGSTRTQTLTQALNSEAATFFRSQLDVPSDPICSRCVCSLNYRPHSETRDAAPERIPTLTHPQSRA